MSLYLKILLVFTLIVSSNAFSQDTIRVNDFSDPNGDYATKIIRLAIAHSDKKYKLEVTHMITLKPKSMMRFNQMAV